MDSITIKELVENIEKLNFEDIKFLLDGISMNEEIAEYGLNQKVGIGVGYGMKKSMEEGLSRDRSRLWNEKIYGRRSSRR